MKRFFSLLYILIAVLTANAQDFALGADISWVTQFESNGRKFYNYKGEERETTALMKELGLNAIRLRVWVNPQAHGTWCNKEDVLVKAKRAHDLGMDIMIDFHYSDSWADPAKQPIPAAWADHKYKQMQKDVAVHTTEVLKLLKDNGITPKWVQVGNETSNGFLWPMGNAKENPKQYAGLFTAGYDATKAVFPQAKVIVHLDNGFDEDLYRWNLDVLRDNGAKWDIIGMSIYPYWAKDSGKEPSAARLFNDMRKNIKKVVDRYGTDVIITETGFEVDEKNPWKMQMGREQLMQLIDICRNETKGRCLGVFYWEPTADPSHYKLGAFTSDGHPTDIMRAFTVQNCVINGGDYAQLAKTYDRPLLKLETTDGDIVVELYNETPLHRDNYLRIADSHALDSTLFHRVINNFMIQGGDPTSKDAFQTSADFPADELGNESVPGPDGKEYTLPAEILPQFYHHRGALAAAREGDSTNPEKRSRSSQFYIVWGDWPVHKSKSNPDAAVLPYYNEDYCYGTPWLDGSYTVFGEVISGLKVVEKIQRRSTDKNDRPLANSRILHFTNLRNAE